MAKYCNKLVIIDATPYQDGIEDGYICHTLEGQFIGYFYKNDSLPKSIHTPAIRNSEGWFYIESTDYIITKANGERYPCRYHIFHMNYELLDKERSDEVENNERM